MKAPEETSDQLPAISPRGPVFVDESGRRHRRVKMIGLGVVGLVAAYVILVVAAFIGGSGSAAPFLPLPAAAGPRETPTSPPSADPRAGLTGPAVPVVEQPVAAVPVPVSAVTALPPAAGAAVVPPAPAAPAAAPSPAPTAAPAAPGMSGTATGSGGTAPGSSGTAQGSSATAPGASGSAPGQTTRPTAPAHQ